MIVVDFFLPRRSFRLTLELVRVNTFDLCMYYNIKANEEVR